MHWNRSYVDVGNLFEYIVRVCSWGILLLKLWFKKKKNWKRCISSIYSVFCLQGPRTTRAEHCLERSEDLGLSPLDLWQFALSFLNRVPQLLAKGYINGGPSQKAHSPSEAVRKRWRGEGRKNRKRKSSKRVWGSPWALCSSCCSCCCSAVVFSHVSTAFCVSGFCWFMNPLKKWCKNQQDNDL